MARRLTENRSAPLLLVSCICFCVFPALRAQTSPSPLAHEPQIWSINLKQLGYKRPPSYSRRFRVGDDIVKIQFLDSDRLALAWLATDEIAKKPTPATDVPRHLHLSILDAKKGEQVAFHDWACSPKLVNIAYTASSQWLISNGGTVTLYSASFDKVKDLQQVEVLNSQNGFVSPSGRTFLVHAIDDNTTWSEQLLDSATFGVLDSWNDARFAKASFWHSDRFIVAHTFNPEQWFFRSIGNSWKPFLPPNDAPSTHGYIYGFLNDDLLLSRSGQQVTVGTAGESPLFTLSVPEPGLLFYKEIPQQGTRFGMVLDQMRGLRAPRLDMYPFLAANRVVVYSISKKQAIFSLKLNGTSPWFP